MLCCSIMWDAFRVIDGNEKKIYICMPSTIWVLKTSRFGLMSI
uniref:Uncharacterized protein n=1 Tax=Manihot esculenta TaxID=3983 RepID=A0A2C9WG46_MANES